MGQRINRERLKKMIELEWPPSVALGFRLAPAEALALDDIAEAKGTTLSTLASRIMSQYVRERKDDEPNAL